MVTNKEFYKQKASESFASFIVLMAFILVVSLISYLWGSGSFNVVAAMNQIDWASISYAQASLQPRGIVFAITFAIIPVFIISFFRIKNTVILDSFMGASIIIVLLPVLEAYISNLPEAAESAEYQPWLFVIVHFMFSIYLGRLLMHCYAAFYYRNSTVLIKDAEQTSEENHSNKTQE